MDAPIPAVPRYRPLLTPLLLLLALTALSAAVLLLTAWFGPVPVAWGDLRLDAALEALANSAELMAAVLGVVVTVVAIVVELAANRYSHEITRLFLRDPVNQVVLGLLVVATLQCIWVGMVVGDAGDVTLATHPGIALNLGLVTASLLLLVPYIYFVFTFLSPLSVIERICRDAYREVLRVDERNVERSQQRVEEAVDQLQDVARSAITQGDRSIAMAAVDAMAGLLVDYQQVRDRLPEPWFEVTGSVARDPDFVALGADTLADVRRQRIWLERKVFRRYLSLMGQGAGHARDVANLIGIHTQELACRFGGERPELLALCMHTLNSYLRACINARDPRTAYFLMDQYRLVGEHRLRHDDAASAVTVAGFLREYGQIAHKMGISFLLETAAYDVTKLIEVALDTGSPGADPLLDCLLSLDQQIREESHEDSLLGVRRSQIQLGARLLAHGDHARAERIAADLAGERPERLERLRQGLLQDDRDQFWELMDRGGNFAYLAPELRPFLAGLFERISAARGRNAVAEEVGVEPTRHDLAPRRL